MIARHLRHVRCIRRHLRRHWISYGALTVVYALLHQHYRLALNAGHSLPGHVYLIELGQRPARAGDLVAFRWQAHAFYRPGRLFVKVLGGLPGQRITVSNRLIAIDGRALARAKPATRRGLPLQVIAEGVVPCGRYYVHGPHPDSLDSRYAVTGLIGEEQIIGRAHVLF